MKAVDLASLEIRMSRSENLPVLPQAAGAVLKLADNPDTTPKELERAVERDSAMTAKLLRVANSAYYGSAKIPTLGRAISFLGLNTVRSVVVSIAMQQLVSGKTQAPSFDRLQFWRHSLATATAARILAKIMLPVKAEEVYCAGMVHDVGFLAMDRFMPAELQSVLDAAKRGDVSFLEVEMEANGFTHAMVGGVLAQRWGLSSLIKHAIEFHHNPLDDADYYETTSIVAAANALAYQAGFPNHCRPESTELPPDVATTIDLPEEQLALVRQVTAQEVAKAEAAFKVA
jgi:HD-like signal output (HDOD) protein